MNKLELGRTSGRPGLENSGSRDGPRRAAAPRRRCRWSLSEPRSTWSS